MAKRKEVPPNIIYANDPPKGEEIVKALVEIYMRSQGVEVAEIEVKPSTTGKTTFTIRSGNSIYKAEKEVVKCERL